MVQWADIAAECGNYKDGFVTVFHKYEGQSTDERDKAGHVVKVTPSTFADHMGIPRDTFRRWVKYAVDTEFASGAARQQRTATSHANVTKNLAKADPVALVDAIELAGPATMAAVAQRLAQRRAGLPKPTTPAERKAVEAEMSDLTSGLNVVDLDECVTVVAILSELSEQVQQGIARGRVQHSTLTAIADMATKLAEMARAGEVFVQ